jgi:hypothetical protein
MILSLISKVIEKGAAALRMINIVTPAIVAFFFFFTSSLLNCVRPATPNKLRSLENYLFRQNENCNENFESISYAAPLAVELPEKIIVSEKLRGFRGPQYHRQL